MALIPGAEEKGKKITDLAEFKTHAAEVAVRYAEEYEMCGAVYECLRECGLGAFIPPKAILQRNRGRDCGGGWHDWLTYDGLNAQHDALAALHTQRAQHNGAHISGPAISALMSNDEIVAAMDKWKEQNADQIKLATKTPTSYPLYRVIIRGGPEDNKVVYQEAFAPRKTAAKKTAAKKTTAKKAAPRRARRS